MTSAPNQPLGYWLAVLDQLLDAAFDAALDEEGIGRLHWQAFNTLAGRHLDDQALRQALGPFAPVEPLGLAEVLADLRFRGWLSGAAAQGYEVTPDGLEAHRRIAARVTGVRQRLMSGLTPSDYAQCVETLRRMAANLSHPA